MRGPAEGKTRGSTIGYRCVCVRECACVWVSVRVYVLSGVRKQARTTRVCLEPEDPRTQVVRESRFACNASQKPVSQWLRLGGGGRIQESVRDPTSCEGEEGVSEERNIFRRSKRLTGPGSLTSLLDPPLLTTPRRFKCFSRFFVFVVDSTPKVWNGPLSD